MARGRTLATAVGLALVISVTTAISTTPATAVAPSPEQVAAAAYARMSTAQRIGQLLMGAAPVTGSTATARTLLLRYHVGNVLLVGQSYGGTTALAALVAPVRRAVTQGGVLPFVAADQEGGYVQHLRGPGISAIPTALAQGRLAPSTLRADWRIWAAQVRRAGVNLDLAPVADVVPAATGTRNAPIGRWYREYGYTPTTVSPHVDAVVRGMRDVGLVPVAKHFPGLGRATGNTDTTLGVTDPTRRYDAYLAPYRAAIVAGAPAVMVSTAVYPGIDPGRIGAFSHLVVTTMLRRDLGFTGVILSDSLTAASVSRYSYGYRAILALSAGVDILVVSSNAPVPAMTAAITDRMRTSAVFAAVVRTAVIRVLTAKARAGLIP